MARTILGIFKIPLFFFIIGGVFITCTFWKLIIRDKKKLRHFYTRTVSLYSRLGLWFMNVDVTVYNDLPDDSHALLVGNHQGMLDILILAADHPSLFITSVDLRESSALGILAEMGGSLYVERRNRDNIHNELKEIRDTLREGHSVILFPEGTSTNGERVLPFKKTLMTAVAGTGIPIRPFVINFRSVNGEAMADKWRDYVCWYGDVTFKDALWRLLTVRSIKVDVEYFPEVIVHSEEQRREIAAQVQSMVESKFTPIPKPQMQTSSNNL